MKSRSANRNYTAHTTIYTQTLRMHNNSKQVLRTDWENSSRPQLNSTFAHTREPLVRTYAVVVCMCGCTRMGLRAYMHVLLWWAPCTYRVFMQITTSCHFLILRSFFDTSKSFPHIRNVIHHSSVHCEIDSLVSIFIIHSTCCTFWILTCDYLLHA